MSHVSYSYLILLKHGDELLLFWKCTIFCTSWFPLLYFQVSCRVKHFQWWTNQDWREARLTPERCCNMWNENTYVHDFQTEFYVSNCLDSFSTSSQWIWNELKDQRSSAAGLSGSNSWTVSSLHSGVPALMNWDNGFWKCFSDVHCRILPVFNAWGS